MTRWPFVDTTHNPTEAQLAEQRQWAKAQADAIEWSKHYDYEYERAARRNRR